MENYFEGHHSLAKQKINSALVHVQTYYCHASLGAQIKIERIGDIVHIDKSFPPEDIDWALKITKQIIGTADLVVYVNGHFNEFIGLAGCIGCVCDTEIGWIDPYKSGTSRSWEVYKYDRWGRHCGNFYGGDLLDFAYVKYFFYLTLLNIIFCCVNYFVMTTK